MSAELNPALLRPGAAGASPATQGTPARDRTAAPAGPSFADTLKQATAGNAGAPVRFSKHALERAERRGIPLDQATIGRLQEGVSRISAKGSRDSLVLVDGTGFVVSVNNRTVITAVGAEHMREHVFTNIDSAVIA